MAPPEWSRGEQIVAARVRFTTIVYGLYAPRAMVCSRGTMTKNSEGDLLICRDVRLPDPLSPVCAISNT
jgi:hypothetical protein